MIDKDDLKGKYITYRDKNGATRTNKVIAINGNTVTVKDVVDTRRRVKHDRVLCRCFPKSGTEEIKWNVKK